MTTYSFKEDKIWCGCYTGTLKEFEEKVKAQYKSGMYRVEYLGLIAYIKKIAKELK